MEGKNKIKLRFFYMPMTLVWVIFCLFSWPAFASSEDIVITEIMSDPLEMTDAGKTEWVELYFNRERSFVLGPKNKSEEYQIKGFYLCAKWDLASDTCKSTYPVYALNENLEIDSGTFAIITKDPAIFRATYPDFDDVLILQSNFNLLGNEDGFMAYSTDGKISWQEKFSYGKISISTLPGLSFERISPEENINDPQNWQRSYACGGTPGQLSSSRDEQLENIIINELLPRPAVSGQEFIELFNKNDFDVNFGCWSLEDRASHKIALSENISANGYVVIYPDSPTLNDTGGETLILKNPAGEEVSKAEYTGSAKINYSYAFSNGKYYWTITPTPEIENVITEETTSGNENICKDKKCPEKVFLNEILANPKKDEQKNEYIEIVNKEDTPTDLFGWTIRDASKTGKFIFKDHILIEPQKFLILYRPETKLALNNSTESVYLLNPAEKLTSSASWQKTPENVSYNYDGKHWHWSKFLTPGKKNKFDDPPSLKLAKPKNVYKNTTANFSVKAIDKETKHLKYVWDFGDGHKSYLKETSHKYLKTGNYGVKLTVSDESQSIEKSFNIAVKKYPRPKIEITKVVPNPKGLDSEKETISLLNKSGKKVNLLNYKIATGSKSLVNHPITIEIILAPGEEKIITREDSKIVLNNKAGKVALLYPDGKTADEVEYAKEKIEEDEAYAMLDGKWQWMLAENKNEIAKAPQDNSKGVIAGASTENETFYATYSSKYTLEDYFIFLSALGLLQNSEEKINCCQKDYSYPSPAYLLATSL